RYLPLSPSVRGVHPRLHSFPTRRSSDLRRQRDIVGVGFFEGLTALANHRLDQGGLAGRGRFGLGDLPAVAENRHRVRDAQDVFRSEDTRLNSSHQIISYAVFCLKKKKQT